LQKSHKDHRTSLTVLLVPGPEPAFGGQGSLAYV
jgi:hypothetical protein